MENVIHTIDPSNVDRYGFFCYKSKPKTPGYRQKRDWLEGCLSQGLRLKIIYEGNRSAGFIEYAPGEATWRAVQAPGYMVIHCMWVVGSGKGKGYGARLLEQVISEADSLGMFGVAVVTSTSTWLVKNGFFLHHGFLGVDQAPPSFELLVKRFGSGSNAELPTRLGKPSQTHPARAGGLSLRAVPVPCHVRQLTRQWSQPDGHPDAIRGIENQLGSTHPLASRQWGFQRGLRWPAAFLSPHRR